MSLVLFQFKDQTVRTVVGGDGEVLFVGKDVCEILGYSNPNDAMNDHCRGVATRYPLLTPGGKQDVRVLIQADVLRLIVRSKKPEAVEFEKWVFEEVLPSISATGGYNVIPQPPQQAVQIPATPASQARNIIEEGMAVAALFGVPVHIAQAESVKLARINTGFDFSGYLLVAPAQDNIREGEVMLEPTELGRRLNVSKAKINPLLAELGLQAKVGSEWVPTEKGLSICFKHQWVVGTKSGYNLKWNVAAVSKLIQEKE